MTRQHIDTYGLSLSPILANFQKTPNTLFVSHGNEGLVYPCLFRSMTAGICACKYVDVHIVKSITRSRLSKLNNADIFILCFDTMYSWTRMEKWTTCRETCAKV